MINNFVKNINKINIKNGLINSLNNSSSNNNSIFKFYRFYCNSNNSKNNNESIQDINYKEKEVDRIIKLLYTSQYYLKNQLKFKRYQNINFEEMVNNNSNASGNIQVKDIKEYNSLKGIMDGFTALDNSFKDYKEIVEMSNIEKDLEMLDESKSLLNSIYNTCIDLEINALMVGQDDSKSCFIEMHAGAGGLDSMDWNELIYQMYIAWGERKGFNVKVIEYIAGEFGLRRATLKFEGTNAFGWLRTEMGIHKLIRISPFNADSKRHTSFASVVVYPISDDDDSANIELKPNDLKIEFTRSSGSGGQHVNKTESAVRILHIPTNISVFCSSERSQHQNKSIALDLLKNKISRYYINIRNEKEKMFRDDLGSNGFGSGNIVRTYTMHPQERVKDQRTNYETSQLNKILNGEEELDRMIKSALSVSTNQ